MSSGSRVLFCKSLLSSIPSLPAAYRFNSLASSSSASASRVFKMSADSSSTSSASDTSASSAIDFLSLCHRLKVSLVILCVCVCAFLFVINLECVVIQTTKRAGWVKRGIQDPESIGDHMYRMGLMALISSDMPGVNRDKFVHAFYSF